MSYRQPILISFIGDVASFLFKNLVDDGQKPLSCSDLCYIGSSSPGDPFIKNQKVMIFSDGRINRFNNRPPQPLIALLGDLSMIGLISRAAG